MKKRIIYLGGRSIALSANGNLTDAASIANDSGGPIEILEIDIRFKAGLEASLVDLNFPKRTIPLIFRGNVTPGAIGANYDSTHARRSMESDPIEMADGESLSLQVAPVAAVAAGDIAILLKCRTKS